MSFYWLVLGVLAVFRATHLLNAEDGPWDILVRLRRRLGPGALGALIDCFNCLSLWLAAPVSYVVASTWREAVLVWFALSGGAIVLQRLQSPAASYIEDPRYIEEPKEP